MRRIYEADESEYAKGDRVWVQRGYGSREPAVVIGHYVAWGSYRVVYMGDPAERETKAVEKWRLSFRRKGEKHWQAETPATQNRRPKPADK
jgi:hypothetical protein